MVREIDSSYLVSRAFVLYCIVLFQFVDIVFFVAFAVLIIALCRNFGSRESVRKDWDSSFAVNMFYYFF